MLTWERRLAKKYYDKLFKEYAIADLSRYEEGAVGLRWRTEREVVSGKGQFSCGARRCDQFNDLESYEVDFSYREAGEKKQALVKLRVCPACARRLNYRHARRKARREAKEARREAKRQRVAAPAAGAQGAAAHPGTRPPTEAAAGLAIAAADSSAGSLGPAAGAPAATVAQAKTSSRGSAADAKPGAAGAPGGGRAVTRRAGPVAADTVWSQPIRATKAIGDEFNEYFDDLLQ